MTDHVEVLRLVDELFRKVLPKFNWSSDDFDAAGLTRDEVDLLNALPNLVQTRLRALSSIGDDDPNVLIAELRQEVSRLRALSPAGGEHAEAERRSMAQRAEAWDAVVSVLFELCPDWACGQGTGIELAVAAIRGLAAAPQPQDRPYDWPECSGDPMDCPENEGFGCCKPVATPARGAGEGDDPFGDMPAPIGNPEAWPPNYADGYNDAVRNMVDSFPSVRARLTTRPTSEAQDPSGQTLAGMGGELALNVRHPKCHEAANAFWNYWNANGETHRHGYYESTWGAINQALRVVGVIPHDYSMFLHLELSRSQP